jgi:hypothetical protein
VPPLKPPYTSFPIDHCVHLAITDHCLQPFAFLCSFNGGIGNRGRGTHLIDATAPVSSSLLTSAFLREFYYPFTDRIFLQAAFAFPLLLWPLLCGSAPPFANHPSCPSHSVLNISSYVCLRAMIISLLLYITAGISVSTPQPSFLLC